MLIFFQNFILLIFIDFFKNVNALSFVYYLTKIFNGKYIVLKIDFLQVFLINFISVLTNKNTKITESSIENFFD